MALLPKSPKLNKVAYQYKTLINNKVNSYLNQHPVLILFFLFLISSVEFITYEQSNNLWYILSRAYSYFIPCILYLLFIIFISYSFSKTYKKDYFILNRIGDIKIRHKIEIIALLKLNSILFSLFFVFNLSFSIMRGYMNVGLINDYMYKIPILIYLLVEVVKLYFYCTILSITSYIISNLDNKIISILFLIICLFDLIITPNVINFGNIIGHQITIISHLCRYNFITFTTEILDFLINISIRIIVMLILYLTIIRKREY